MNGRLALFAMLVSSILLSGCVPPWDRPVDAATVTAADESAYQAGEEAYLAGRFRAAANHMGRYARAAGETPRGLRARYWQGMSLVADGRVGEGRERLEDVRQSEAADAGLRAMALRGLARAAMKEKDYATAEDLLRRLNAFHPDHSSEAEVLALLAECLEEQGDHEGAARYRKRLRILHPDSPYAQGGATASGSVPGSKHIVQAGLYSSRIYAERLVRKLRANGVEAIVNRTGRGYVVQAGSFSSRQRAERHAGRLRSMGFDALVKP
jgi:tetratricopeptide (TPR) repeat protein